MMKGEKSYNQEYPASLSFRIEGSSFPDKQLTSVIQQRFWGPGISTSEGRRIGTHRGGVQMLQPHVTAGEELGCTPHTVAQKVRAEAALVPKNWATLHPCPPPLQHSLAAAEMLGTSQWCYGSLETEGSTVGSWPWLPATMVVLRGPRRNKDLIINLWIMKLKMVSKHESPISNAQAEEQSKYHEQPR